MSAKGLVAEHGINFFFCCSLIATCCSVKCVGWGIEINRFFVGQGNVKSQYRFVTKIVFFALWNNLGVEFLAS